MPQVFFAFVPRWGPKDGSKECSRITKVDCELSNRSQLVTAHENGREDWITVRILRTDDAKIEIQEIGVVVDHEAELDKGEIVVAGVAPEQVWLNDFLRRFITGMSETEVVGKVRMDVDRARQNCLDSQLLDLASDFEWEEREEMELVEWLDWCDQKLKVWETGGWCIGTMNRKLRGRRAGSREVDAVLATG
jgi:hypothetical protein